MPIRKPPFRALTLKSNGLIDRLITDIEVCAAFDPQNPPSQVPQRLAAKALWDTGASKSVLAADFARQLGLVSTGLTEVHHGDGSSKRDTFMVNFYLPNGVGIVGVRATEFPASHSQFAVLVGMDVIRIGDFAITNLGGSTWMSFRTPSHARIDYVAEADKITFGNMGRNEPCYCGSGEKYKKCHGANR